MLYDQKNMTIEEHLLLVGDFFRKPNPDPGFEQLKINGTPIASTYCISGGQWIRDDNPISCPKTYLKEFLSKIMVLEKARQEATEEVDAFFDKVFSTSYLVGAYVNIGLDENQDHQINLTMVTDDLNMKKKEKKELQMQNIYENPIIFCDKLRVSVDNFKNYSENAPYENFEMLLDGIIITDSLDNGYEGKLGGIRSCIEEIGDLSDLYFPKEETTFKLFQSMPDSLKRMIHYPAHFFYKVNERRRAWDKSDEANNCSEVVSGAYSYVNNSHSCPNKEN